MPRHIWTETRSTGTIRWRSPTSWGGRSAGAIRKGNWKLIEFFDTGETELYDLAKDPGEQHNLAKEESDKRRNLLEALHAWQRSVGAAIPEGQRQSN
ncbi:MAG: DUF4976 domain-containing protein [Planctomycetes bacterium]|nr:DUF4976 domain-containing protein [Planctomycetota bacterium]